MQIIVSSELIQVSLILQSHSAAAFLGFVLIGITYSSKIGLLNCLF